MELDRAIGCHRSGLQCRADVAKVVKDVRRNLPGALIIGVDNRSTDGSRQLLRTVADETIEFDAKGRSARQGRGAARGIRPGTEEGRGRGSHH